MVGADSARWELKAWLLLFIWAIRCCVINQEYSHLSDVSGFYGAKPHSQSKYESFRNGISSLNALHVAIQHITLISLSPEIPVKLHL